METKEIKALTEQIDQISETVVASLQKSKKEMSDKVVEEVKTAKDDLSKEVKVVKDELTNEVKLVKEEATKITEKAKELDDEVTKAKNAAQQIQVKVDEMDKKMNASRIFQQETKGQSFGEILSKAMLEVTDEIAKIASKDNGRKKSLALDLKVAGDVSISGNYSGGSRALQILEPGIHTGPRRKVHMREVIPGGSVGTGTEYVFMKENGVGQGAPASAAESATLAQIDVSLNEASVKIENIGAWLRVTRKAMNNIPGFISYLQQRIPERLLRVEDTLILTGDGVSPNIKGIMTAGNFTASTSVATTLVDAIIDDLTLLEDTNERYADRILLRPKEYYNFFKNKASGSGEYDLPENVSFVNGQLYISGIPVYASTAVPANQYLLGDFAMGCQFLIQEGMRLEFFEQDGTNVRENKITVRIEENAALPIYGSDFFVVGAVPV